MTARTPIGSNYIRNLRISQARRAAGPARGCFPRHYIQARVPAGQEAAGGTLRRASTPDGLPAPTCAADCSGARPAARPSPPPRPRAASPPTTFCHSLLKRGSGTCKTPGLNTRTFEKLIVKEIKENILSESTIQDLVKLLDEEMDGVAHE